MPERRIPSVRVLAHAAAAIAFAASTAMSPAWAGLSEAVARIKPSIVAVGTYQKTRSPAFVFRGTGFAVQDGMLIATAAHAVPEALQVENRETMMILVAVPGAREPQAREAKVVALDKVHDVAVLRVDGTPLPAVTLGDSGAVRDGASIAFTGFPFGNALGFHPVTHRGIISSQTPLALPSATARDLDPRVINNLKTGTFVLFQLDAIAYPGHSGSPLYHSETGDVIGIVNMGGFVRAMKDNAVGQPTSISFAVPAGYLQDLLRGLR